MAPRPGDKYPAPPTLEVGDRVRKAHYPDAGRVDQLINRGMTSDHGWSCEMAFVTWDRTGQSWEYTHDLGRELA